jgi:hypothetical protein
VEGKEDGMVVMVVLEDALFIDVFLIEGLKVEA